MSSTENLTEFKHTTVMLQEAVEALNIQADGIYVDGTYGRGGHSSLILSKLGKNGKLIVFDKDTQAIAHAKSLQAQDPRLIVIHDSFASLAEQINALGLSGAINGILLDLGVSSPQLDDAERGFSFMHNGPLDMRMDQTRGLSAREYLWQVEEKELAKVLWEYGEEKNSRKIARAIVNLRDQVNFEQFLPDTNSLVELIKKNSPLKDKNKNPATRSFQAIRIKVNSELDDLETVLKGALKVLATDGRLSIITFHSLEDRIVKQFYSKHHKGKQIPKDLPITDDNWDFEINLAEISKAIKPTAEEIAVNPRSRSAILRYATRSSRKID